jgi:hypothetical protein
MFSDSDLICSDLFFSSSISLRRLVADASSSSYDIERRRLPRAPLRNGAGEATIEGAMAGADDEIVWPLTGNDDLIAAGLAPEDDDDTHDDVAALFGIDVGGGPAAPIDLDGSGREGDRSGQQRWRRGNDNWDLGLLQWLSFICCW